jgi:hypothetical protein
LNEEYKVFALLQQVGAATAASSAVLPPPTTSHFYPCFTLENPVRRRSQCDTSAGGCQVTLLLLMTIHDDVAHAYAEIARPEARSNLMPF